MSDIVERLRANEWNNSNDRDDAIGLAADEIERLRVINAELVAALGGLILHVEEFDHYGERCGEAAEMKIARKAYQVAAKAKGENK